MMNLKLILLAILSSLSGTRASLHKPSQYSLGGVQAVNGSDINGGCPSGNVLATREDEDENLFGYLRSRYCSSSIGVISDGATAIGDLSRPDWASTLLTISRSSQNTAVLAFKFQSQFTLRGMRMTVFICPSWNISAPSIYLYSYYSPSAIKLLVVSDVKSRIEAVRCGLHSFEVLLEERNAVTNDRYYITFMFDTVDAQWVHIAEVLFSDMNSVHASPLRATVTPTSSITMKDIIAIDKSLFVRQQPGADHIPHETVSTAVAITPTPGLVSNTKQTVNSLDTLPQQDSTLNNNVIIASVVGSTVVVLLCMAFTLVSVCIILKKIRKSRQSCSTEGSVSQLMTSKVAYNMDSTLDSAALAAGGSQATKLDIGRTTYEQNIAYVCHFARDSAAHIYQEIPSPVSDQTRGRSEDVVMMQNVAYSDPVVHRQVICVDNVAYASSSQIQHGTHNGVRRFNT